MNRPLVIVFARAPRYGAVKTRLARDIGAGEALRFYRHALDGLVRRIRRDGRFALIVAVTPDTFHLRLPQVWVASQGGGDLGRRMVRALRAAGRRPAIVVGSDIPGITPSHLAQAFRALREADVVLGPARDGGYWLIGARSGAMLRPWALDGVRWSSVHTLSDNVKRLPQVRVLDSVLEDVDDGASYRRLKVR